MEKDENKLKGQKKRAKSQTIKAVSGMIASQKQEEIEISLFYVKTPKTHNSRTSPAYKMKKQKQNRYQQTENTQNFKNIDEKQN